MIQNDAILQYQFTYDIQCGRVEKIHREIVRVICRRAGLFWTFGQVNGRAKQQQIKKPSKELSFDGLMCNPIYFIVKTVLYKK